MFKKFTVIILMMICGCRASRFAVYRELPNYSSQIPQGWVYMENEALKGYLNQMRPLDGAPEALRYNRKCTEKLEKLLKKANMALAENAERIDLIAPEIAADEIYLTKAQNGQNLQYPIREYQYSLKCLERKMKELKRISEIIQSQIDKVVEELRERHLIIEDLIEHFNQKNIPSASSASESSAASLTPVVAPDAPAPEGPTLRELIDRFDRQAAMRFPGINIIRIIDSRDISDV